ncbi:MAG: glycosyltransferase family 39 protein [Gordonia sp. (in: high G+C Gram-positive bacteria)]|uniref:ArnT family glycosyltransferase n=1 Tax=Gordonia sp. (in: high G+C Gram-positive bacteria) TaxID=84139 RepID=UPI0039E4BE10
MTATVASPVHVPDAHPAPARPSRRLTLTVFAVCWVIYLAVGIYLAVDQQYFFGDALSRVQAAQSVLYSRDPHLSAIGFIFTPLTAVVQLPLIALSPWFPALTADALSSVIMSSAFMAGAVAVLTGVARDRGVPPALTLVVVGAFAVNPMIVLYGANGMSEAPAVFFIVWAARCLIRWVDTDDVHELVSAGIALALGFLTRYDLGAAAGLAAFFVAVVSYRRPQRTDKKRQRALIDAALVLAPAGIAFVAWALTSWIINGELLAQFTSEYGNAAIIAQSGGTGSTTTGQALGFSVTEMLIMAPLLPVLLAAVFVVRARRRRLYPLVAVLVVCVAVLGFQTFTYLRGSTFGFLRFYLTVVPLAAVVALLAVPATRLVPWRRLGREATLPTIADLRRFVYAGLAVLAAVAMVLAVPVTVAGMGSPKHAPQEFALRTVVDPDPRSVDKEYLDGRKVARTFSTERSLADYLDSLNLPDGSVLTDTVYGFAVVVRSRHPKQFVIPSDQDFPEILNDPVHFGVKYMLSVPDTGRGKSDALNLRYPTLYETGADIAVLRMEARNQGQDQPDWRIYEVVGDPGDPGGG